MIRSIKFERDKEYNWFAVLPEWTGEKWELEMVMGADTMLDYIAQGDDEVSLTLGDELFNGYVYTLTFINESDGGAYYRLEGLNLETFDVWLCHVTKFVFGWLPTKIYIK